LEAAVRKTASPTRARLKTPKHMQEFAEARDGEYEENGRLLRNTAVNIVNVWLPKSVCVMYKVSTFKILP